MASPLQKPVPFDPSGDLTGTTIGRFAIRERLGGGGMGEVYRADDTTLKRPVAVKRLAQRLREDQRYHRRFMQEAERASALNSPHIASIYDVMDQSGQLFLVMEYVEGANLRHRMQQPVSLSEFLKIALQCAEALVSAHEKGIVHRDLKPENIMLTPAGGVKVLDFGLAKRLLLTEETLESSRLDSQSGGFAGTPGYMAPELVLEAEPDGRADIFSLGVVFHEMLYGRHPFLTRKLVVTPGGIAHEVASPAVGGKNVPPPLQELVNRMLAKDLADRVASARDVLNELRVIWHQVTHPTLTSSDLLPGLEAPARSRTRPALWAAVAVLVVAGFAVWRMAPPAAPAERIRVAVVPFSNQTGDPSLDRLRMTLTQMLVLNLTGSPNVQVLPYERLAEITQGLEASGKDVTRPEAIQTVADYGNSRFVVVPQIFSMGNTVRISAEFRDGQTGEAVGAAKTERIRSGTQEETLYSMLDELSESIEEHFRQARRGEQHRPRPSGSRPQSVDAAFDYTEGKNALARGNYAQALQSFQQVVDRDPNFALAYARMGQIYGMLGYDERARELSEKAAGLVRPDTPLVDAYFIQANLAERNYDQAAAEQAYLQLQRLFPDDPEPYTGLAEVEERRGQYQKAIGHYQNALLRDANYIVVHQALGLAYARTSDYARALSHGEKALGLYQGLGNRQGEASATADLAEIHRLRESYGEAGEYAQRALDLARETGSEFIVLRAHKLLGDIAFSEGKQEEARNHYQQVVSASSELRNNRLMVTVLMNLGVTYHREGDLTRAVEYYERSVAAKWSAQRERAEAMTNLAAIYVEYGPDAKRGAQLAQEAQQLFQLMGLAGWEARNHITRGIFAMNGGEFDQAAGSFQSALKLFQTVGYKSGTAWVNYNLGRAYFFQNRYQQALDALNSATAQYQEAQNPFGVVLSRILLGWTHARLGDTAHARTLLEQNLKEAQSNRYGELLPDAYLALGEVYREAGEPARARESFQQGAALGKEPSVSESSIEARSGLGRLEAEEGSLERALVHGLAALARARRLEHRHTVARATVNLAEIHLRRKEYQRAVDALASLEGTGEVGLELQAQADFLMGRALEGLGKKAEARASQKKAVEAIRKLQQSFSPGYRAGFAARRDIKALLPSS